MSSCGMSTYIPSYTAALQDKTPDLHVKCEPNYLKVNINTYYIMAPTGIITSNNLIYLY